MQKRVSQIVMVDSLDRDQNVYPLPTEVRLKLPRTYKNVEQIEIVQIKFFCGIYSISDTLRNNSFSITDPSGSYTLMIPNGTYSLMDLLSSMEDLITIVLPTNNYSLIFNPISGRVTISGIVPFSISLFKTPLVKFVANSYSEWGLGWILGWNGKPVVLSGSSSYTSSGYPRIGGGPGLDYIFLQLNDTEQMNCVDHTGVENTGLSKESSGQVSHYFGKLLLNTYGCWSQTFIESPKLYSPALGRLERIQCTWTDRTGNKIAGQDAISCDWHMTLRITEIID